MPRQVVVFDFFGGWDQQELPKYQKMGFGMSPAFFGFFPLNLVFFHPFGFFSADLVLQ